MPSWITAALAIAASPAVSWTQLEPGLELCELDAPVRSAIGDSRVTIVRIDPRRRPLRLLMASELGGGKRTARRWAAEHHLALVVNAGMFEARGDQSTSHHYLRSGAHTNNARMNGDNAFLVFDPIDDTVPPLQIIDRKHQDLAALLPRYRSVVQGIRMISRARRNTWAAQPRRWSMVIAATDTTGRLLFIFTRSPHTVHDFVNQLLALPLELSTTMYLEGGPEASLWLDAAGVRRELCGSYETGFYESDDNADFWPVPNVLGVASAAHR